MAGITVLGSVAVGDAGPDLSPRDRVVLAVLVVHLDREVPAETLAEALWREALPSSWPKVVQGCIARLRRRLGAGAIVTGQSGYRLVVPADEIDAGRFERLVHRSRELLALGHADQAAYAARQALSLWHGRPLPDLEEWEPGRGEAQRLTELRLLAEELQLDALLASGRHDEAMAEATLRVREEPLREHRWGLLARAQYQDGRQAEALATLRRARIVLAEELGLDPGPELVQLEQAVLRQDPSLEVAAAGLPSATCPWPGLASYDVDDADAFFGRDVEVAECLERLGRTGFLAVVGPSGSGKSSLVRAGLAARLRGQGRRVQVITPEPRPLDALAAAPLRGRSSVLVVDQCEAAFASSLPHRVRTDFVAGLVEQAAGGPVILALRADRLGELSAYPALATLVEDGLYLLKGMGEEGLREAIERPARQDGLLLEHGLVDLLVRDVAGEPGSLPLLAHALRQTWERREGATLTVEGYRASGGIQGAVAQSAEQVYEAATPDQRQALRELLLRMVQLGPQGDPVRTSVPRDFLAGDAEHAALLEQLIRARLVTAAEDRWEIAHEALARAWPRLQGWLVDDVEGERIRHHLAATADAWSSMGRPHSELYRGARLAAALEWRATGDHRLSALEREFLDTSDVEHQAVVSRMEAEAARQRRMNRRLRMLVTGVAVLALLGVLVSGLALLQWDRAREASAQARVEADRAHQEAARARSQQLIASAMRALDEDPGLAKALAVLAAQAAPPTVQSNEALHRVLEADRVRARLSTYAPNLGLAASLHPAGDRVALAGEGPEAPSVSVEVQDPETGELLWEHVPTDRGLESVQMAGVAYSPDGRVLVAGTIWHPASLLRVGPPDAETALPPEGVVGVQVWDAHSYDVVQLIDVGRCGGALVALSDTHALVETMAGTDDAAATPTAHPCWSGSAINLELVELDGGERTVLTPSPVVEAFDSTNGVMSRDGRVVAVASPDGMVVWDTRSAEQVATWPGVRIVALDRNGAHAVVTLLTGPEEYLQVRRVPGGEVVSEYRGHRTTPLHAAFATDGATILSTAEDQVLRVWDAQTGEETDAVPGVGDGQPAADGDRVLVARSDGPVIGSPRREEGASVAVVDLSLHSGPWSVDRCQNHELFLRQLDASAGVVLAVRRCVDAGLQHGDAEVFDHRGRRTGVIEDAVWSDGLAELSPDGSLVVVQAGDPVEGSDGGPGGSPDILVGSLEVRDVASGQVRVTLQGTCDHQMWRSTTCPVWPQRPFAFSSFLATWSHNSRWVAVHGTTPVGERFVPIVMVWDAVSGEVVASIGDPGHPDGVLVPVFTSDDSKLVIGNAFAHNVLVWDTETWRQIGQATSAASRYLFPVGTTALGEVVLMGSLPTGDRDGIYITRDPTSADPGRVIETPGWTSWLARVSPDGARLAAVTAEREVTVWDLATGALLDRIDPGTGPALGIDWLDEGTLVVLAESGELVALTTDAARLLDEARRTLFRGLTAAECTKDGIDPCPALGELRGDLPSVPPELHGTYRLSWDPLELETAMVQHYQDAVGGALSPDLTDFDIPEAAGMFSGDLELVIDAHSFAVRWQDGDELCGGGARVEAATVRLDAERAGAWCGGIHFLRAGFEVQDGHLLLLPDAFRGNWSDKVLWTTKPLERVG